MVDPNAVKRGRERLQTLEAIGDDDEEDAERKSIDSDSARPSIRGGKSDLDPGGKERKKTERLDDLEKTAKRRNSITANAADFGNKNTVIVERADGTTTAEQVRGLRKSGWFGTGQVRPQTMSALDLNLFVPSAEELAGDWWDSDDDEEPYNSETGGVGGAASNGSSKKTERSRRSHRSGSGVEKELSGFAAAKTAAANAALASKKVSAVVVEELDDRGGDDEVVVVDEVKSPKGAMKVGKYGGGGKTTVKVAVEGGADLVTPAAPAPAAATNDRTSSASFTDLKVAGLEGEGEGEGEREREREREREGEGDIDPPPRKKKTMSFALVDKDNEENKDATAEKDSAVDSVAVDSSASAVDSTAALEAMLRPKKVPVSEDEPILKKQMSVAGGLSKSKRSLASRDWDNVVDVPGLKYDRASAKSEPFFIEWLAQKGDKGGGGKGEEKSWKGKKK